MNRRYFTALILTLMTPLMEACQLHRQASASPRFIVTLIDQSVTMKDFQPHQVADVGKIMASLTGGDTLLFYPVTENPLSSPEPISMALAPYNPSRFNPVTYRAYAERDLTKQARAALAQIKSTIFDQELTPDTALIDSLELAARAFRSAAGRAAHRRELIMLSDMWEDRGKIKFPREKLTEKRIAQLLNQLAAEKRLADLTGVEVWIAGARIHRDSPREFEDGVEAFWLAAFGRMGAKVCVERFAPSLREFPTNPKLVKAFLSDNDQKGKSVTANAALNRAPSGK